VKIVPVVVDFLLSYLIKSTCVRQPECYRRLNGIENALEALGRCWRHNSHEFELTRDVRLAASTAASVSLWVQEKQLAIGLDCDRLRRYSEAPMVDSSVPNGWVRLQARM
jgi:hypothetical protein